MHRDDNFRTSGTPKLVKALGHLTTPISTLRFNHDAQILAMASKDKKDAMRLVGYFFLGFQLFGSSSFQCCMTYFLPSVNRTTLQIYSWPTAKISSLSFEPSYSFPFTSFSFTSRKDLVR